MRASRSLLLSNVLSSSLGRSFRPVVHARCLLTCPSTITLSVSITQVRYKSAQLKRDGFLQKKFPSESSLSEKLAQIYSTHSYASEHTNGSSHLSSAHHLLHLHRQASLPPSPDDTSSISPRDTSSHTPASPTTSDETPRDPTEEMVRKPKEMSPESSLSSVPDEAEEETVTVITTAPSGGGKRKVAATFNSAPRSTKRTRLLEAIEANQDESSAGESHEPVAGTRSEIRAAENKKLAAYRSAVKKEKRKAKITEETKVEDEVKLQDDANDKTQVGKKKTAVRKKKQVDLGPLATRTAVTKLRMGAHVSIAGG